MQRNKEHWNGKYVDKYEILLFKYFYKKIDHFKPKIRILKFGIFNTLRSKIYDNNSINAKKGRMECYFDRTLQIYFPLK